MTTPSLGIPKDRFVAFSDGVFAIAITLLVLQVKVPSHLTPAQLHTQLVAQLPHLGAYFLTFLSIGVFWVAHHSMTEAATCVDRSLLWINNLFLMMVSLLPFPAGLLGEYPHSGEAVALYGLNMALVDGLLLWIWSHIVRHLKRDEVPPVQVRVGFGRTQGGLILCVIGVILGVAGLPFVGIAVFWLSPFSYIALQTIIKPRHS